MATSLLEEIRKDRTYITFRKILDNTKKRLDFDALLKETMGLHASRSSRSLYGEKRYSPKALLDANATDMSNRARMSEIRVQTDLKLNDLREACGAMRKHIITTYGDELKEEGYSGPVAKKMFADRVMKQALAYLSGGEKLIATIDTLIKDLDQAGHSLHRMGEMVKLVSEKRGRVL